MGGERVVSGRSSHELVRRAEKGQCSNSLQSAVYLALDRRTRIGLMRQDEARIPFLFTAHISKVNQNQRGHTMNLAGIQKAIWKTGTT